MRRLASVLVLATLTACGASEDPSGVEGDHSLTASATDPALAKDGVKNGDETDVDCGGGNAARCADGRGCARATDCTSGVCTASTCAAPGPTDGVKNADETDVDCGGAKAPKCALGKACKANEDCGRLVRGSR